MFINESGMCRQIKAAYKGGYKIFTADDCLTIKTPYWLYRAEMKDVPGKVLGLLVEHIGTLDIAGGMLIAKDAPNQIILEEAIPDEINILQADYQSQTVEIPIIYKGVWQLYQSDIAQGIVGFHRKLLDMLDEFIPPLTNENLTSGILEDEGTTQSMYIQGMSHDQENVVMSHLEQFDFDIPFVQDELARDN